MTEAALASPTWLVVDWGGLSRLIASALRAGLHLMSVPDEHAGPAAASDQADLQASLGGDAEAFERIVRRHQQHVGNYLWRFTRDRNDYEDLVHTVFVEAYLSLPRFRGTGTFRAWLLTIATRVGYAYWKQQGRLRRRQDVGLDFVPEPAADEARPHPDLDRLQQALAELPPRDRLVLTLLYLDERSVAEAAQLSGWSQTMVKVQAHRARGKLKQLMSEKCDGKR
jgi:RNA polymerase sigma-70 factor, ECF subfamily